MCTSFFLTYCTPYCQGCDKVHINKAFGDNLSELFSESLGAALEGLRLHVPPATPTRHEMALWTRDSWEESWT